MISTIIADDEDHARKRLVELLDRLTVFDIIAEAKDGNEALQLIITHEPEVVFLDINMPGISVFKSLQSLQKPPLIIFQTAYSQYATDAFDINAIDYLLKPIRFERLEKTVEKINEKLTLQNPLQSKHHETPILPAEHVSVKVSGKTKLIPVKDIIKISFESGFCYLYTLCEKIISDKYLNYYEDKLKDSHFFRVSRTDIINLKHITTIQKTFQDLYTIEMQNGTFVYLSRRRAQLLKKLIDF